MASSMSPVIFFSHAVEDAEQHFRADLVGWIKFKQLRHHRAAVCQIAKAHREVGGRLQCKEVKAWQRGSEVAEICLIRTDFAPIEGKAIVARRLLQADLSDLERLGQAVLVEIKPVKPNQHRRMGGSKRLRPPEMRFRDAGVLVGAGRQAQMPPRSLRQSGAKNGG